MWKTSTKEALRISADERRAMIVEEVNDRSSLQVSDICDRFGISAVTARADLAQLERAGKLRRTHGGAVSITRSISVSYPDQRMNLNVEAKRAIAAAAQRFINEGDSLFIDSGTTTLEFVRALQGTSHITIVTNDLSIASFADANLPHADIMVLGGALRKSHRYITGPIASGILDSLSLDKAIMGTESFDARQGFSTEFMGNAEIKRGMLRHSKTHIMLMDASKVRQPSFMSFASLDDFDAIVMDEDPGGTVGAAIEAAHASTRLILSRSSRQVGHGKNELVGRSAGPWGANPAGTHFA